MLLLDSSGRYLHYNVSVNAGLRIWSKAAKTLSFQNPSLVRAQTLWAVDYWDNATLEPSRSVIAVQSLGMQIKPAADVVLLVLSVSK